MNDYHVAVTETLPELLDHIETLITKRIKQTTSEALKRAMLIDAYKHASANLGGVIDTINIALAAMQEESHPGIE